MQELFNSHQALGCHRASHRKVKGQVKPAESWEYGRMEIHVCGLMDESVEERQAVWMSHGDEVVKLPDGFSIVATTKNLAKRLYGLKYQPKVTHSMHEMKTLHHFLLNACGIVVDWKLNNVLEEKIQMVKDMVGYLLRYKEGDHVLTTFESELHFPVTCIDPGNQFLSKLKGVTDPERKWKIIGVEFIHIFDEFSLKFLIYFLGALVPLPLTSIQDWEKREEEFHFDQSKVRLEIRLREGQARPIDVFSKNLNLCDDIKMHLESDRATPTH